MDGGREAMVMAAENTLVAMVEEAMWWRDGWRRRRWWRTVEAGRAEAMVVEATVEEAMAAAKEVAAMVAVVRSCALPRW